MSNDLNLAQAAAETRSAPMGTGPAIELTPRQQLEARYRAARAEWTRSSVVRSSFAFLGMTERDHAIAYAHLCGPTLAVEPVDEAAAWAAATGEEE